MKDGPAPSHEGGGAVRVMVIGYPFAQPVLAPCPTGGGARPSAAPWTERPELLRALCLGVAARVHEHGLTACVHRAALLAHRLLPRRPRKGVDGPARARGLFRNDERLHAQVLDLQLVLHGISQLCVWTRAPERAVRWKPHAGLAGKSDPQRVTMGRKVSVRRGNYRARRKFAEYVVP